MLLESGYPAAAQHKPDFDAAEPPSQRHLPVPIVNHGSRIAFPGAQESGRDVQGIIECRLVAYKEEGCIKTDQTPFVSVCAKRVCVLIDFDQTKGLATFWQRKGHSGPRSVDM
jgi:hypothetical protein